MVTAADWEVWAVPLADDGMPGTPLGAAWQLPTPSAVSVDTRWNDAGGATVEWSDSAGPWPRAGRDAIIVYRAGVHAWSGVVARVSADLTVGGPTRAACQAVGLLAVMDQNPSRVDISWSGDRQWLATEMVRVGLNPRADVYSARYPISAGWTATGSATFLLSAESQTWGSALRDWVRRDQSMVVAINVTLDPGRTARVSTTVWDARVPWGPGGPIWLVGPGKGLIAVSKMFDGADLVGISTGHGAQGLTWETVDTRHMPIWRTSSHENAWTMLHLQHLVEGLDWEAGARSMATVLTVDPDLSGRPDPTWGWPRLGDYVEMSSEAIGDAYGQIRAVRWQASASGELLQWEI